MQTTKPDFTIEATQIYVKMIYIAYEKDDLDNTDVDALQIYIN